MSARIQERRLPYSHAQVIITNFKSFEVMTPHSLPGIERMNDTLDFRRRLNRQVNKGGLDPNHGIYHHDFRGRAQ